MRNYSSLLENALDIGFAAGRWARGAPLTVLMMMAFAVPGCSVERDKPLGMIVATPSAIEVCSGDGLGSVSVSWEVFVDSIRQVRIEIGQGGDGTTKVFYVGPPKGEMQTENWVRPGMVFILVDSTSGAVIDTAEIQGKSC